MSVTVLVLPLTSCGEQEDPAGGSGTSVAEEPTRTPTETSAEASVDEEHQPPFGPPAACSELIAGGWTAPETEPNITFDSESGLAEVAFTDPKDTIVVDLVTDRACAKLPDVGPLLARTKANNDQAVREYCEDLVAKLNAGELPESDGMTADPEGIRSYVRTDCPDHVARQLKLPGSG